MKNLPKRMPKRGDKVLVSTYGDAPVIGRYRGVLGDCLVIKTGASNNEAFAIRDIKMLEIMEVGK